MAERSFAEILRGVEEEIGAGSYALWFTHCTFGGLERGTLRLEVPSPFACDWIERNYAPLISARAQEVLGTPVRIAVDLGEDPKRGAAEPEESAALRGALAGLEVEEPAGGLADFVVVPENKFAARAVEAVALGLHESYNPLTLIGPSGVGKTHLLRQFATARSAEGKPARTIFVDALEFTSRFTMALKLRRIEEFRAYYEKFDVIVIDEVHRLRNKTATQRELVARLKEWIEQGRRVVLASRHLPKDIHDLLEPLRSCMLGGLTAEIRPYSPASLVTISGCAVGPDRRSVNREVVAHLAEGCRGSARELKLRLLRGAAFAALVRRPFDLGLVRDYHAELVSGAEGDDGRDEVLDEVCRHFGIRRSDLESKRKTRNLLVPRGLAVCILRDRIGLTFKEIGRALGGRSHTSVLLIYRRYGPVVREDATLRRLHESLPSAGRDEAGPRS